MTERTTPDRDRRAGEPLLGENDEIVGGEGGVLSALAQHTPEEFKQASDEEPLLGENDDVPVGGEGGPLIALADHTPKRKEREERPLLDD
jgi:hypothetical protein